MKKLDITSKLNIKISCVVLILACSILGSQWMTMQERKSECAEQIEAITTFLGAELPFERFSEIVRRAKGGETKQAPAETVNKEIQPILSHILVPRDVIKFGVYSRQHGRIVAIGPEVDNSLLTALNTELFANAAGDATLTGEQQNCAIWYGDPVIFNVKPISRDGEVTGYVFAFANLRVLNTEIWQKTTKTFLAILIAITLVIVLFQEVIITLKKDLVLFAEKVVEGQAKDFTSVVPELNPVLTYITEQTENLARLDRLNIIGEMAAGIAHEVRNPMTTVRGFMQFMGGKEEFKGSRDRFNLMIEELDRANIIITEFLSLAKNKNMDFHDIDVNTVITSVFPLLQADAFRCNCQMELELADIPLVLADENSIRQLILNLVRNALEAMPEGGLVVIRTVAWEQKVSLSIHDTGVGISQELLKKLGTPFFTTKDQGTGLGLAVCYRIVQRHQATITIDSTPGEGTTFTIDFPITSPRDG